MMVAPYFGWKSLSFPPVSIISVPMDISLMQIG